MEGYQLHYLTSQVAEAARRKADEELKRVRAEASGAAELAATQVAASKALASSAESALAAKNAEVRACHDPDSDAMALTD